MQITRNLSHHHSSFLNNPETRDAFRIDLSCWKLDRTVSDNNFHLGKRYLSRNEVTSVSGQFKQGVD